MRDIICIAGSIIASIITTKILAAHYFNLVDGHVGDMIQSTKDFVDVAKQSIEIRGITIYLPIHGIQQEAEENK